MFEPAEGPRVFGVPPGVDLAAALVDGLRARTAGQPPEAMARAVVYLPAARMRRRVRGVFDAGPPTLLPRLALVTELGSGPLPGVPPAIPPLRRRLELAQLVERLLVAAPGLAPATAAFDLAESLAQLIDEMHGEGVPFEALRGLHGREDSAHWQQSLAFVEIAAGYAAATGAPEPEARQRLAVERLAAAWAAAPPRHPVIVAGSTGSRGTTALLMQAVARLPQGALLLPGFDFAMPEDVWAQLGEPMDGEDHPQFRFARLLAQLGVGPGAVQPWGGGAPSPARNRLMSLALRPAPVTDAWRREGPQLHDLAEATARMTLIEAPSARAEAVAVALVLREAAEAGRRAALVTPDRLLARRVTASLERWRIGPDDSAGRPLGLSAPGRLLRQVAETFLGPVSGAALLALLKHPLSSTGGAERGPHLRFTRELELHLRRHGPPHPGLATLAAFAGADGPRAAWAEWAAAFLDPGTPGAEPLTERVERHLARGETLAAGPGVPGTGTLWDEAAGREALAQMDALRREAGHGGAMTAAQYAALLGTVLGGEVREVEPTHPEIRILGTLEARMLDADLVILGGLNDGVWPALPAPDPWLNRGMRAAAGLLLPERRVGLSAHDFQQAIAAPEVVLTRALRDEAAETVPSRWLARLTNLLDGLADGQPALGGMRERGRVWLDRARQLEAVERAPALPRPSPRPPVAMRPKGLSVTQIATLIRDPYAIYAREVLRLRKLDPLKPAPDAPLRGSVIHEVLERFVRAPWEADPALARTRLLATANAVLAERVPWPAVQRLWYARLARVADWLLVREAERRALGEPALLESTGVFEVDGFTLRGRADRIDRLGDGSLAIVDYKTGKPPTPDQIRAFDKQLLLEAMMAEQGAFAGIAAAPVAEVAYLGLGTSPAVVRLALDGPEAEASTAELLEGFRRLIAAWRDPGRGYTARMAPESLRFEGDYDHLARYGEWDLGDMAHGEAVG